MPRILNDGDILRHNIFISIDCLRGILIAVIGCINLLISTCEDNLALWVHLTDVIFIVQIILDYKYRRDVLNSGVTRKPFYYLLSSAVAIYSWANLVFVNFYSDCDKEYKTMYFATIIRIAADSTIFACMICTEVYFYCFSPTTRINPSGQIVPPLPVYNYGSTGITNLEDENSVHSISDDAICVICMETYDEEQGINRLHCSHIFHHTCLQEWLLRSFTCPICRQNPFIEN